MSDTTTKTVANNDVVPVKDRTRHMPVPTVWRPAFHGIVTAFLEQDFMLEKGVPGVEPVSIDIEDGFNCSSYNDFGAIGEYWYNQDDLERALQSVGYRIETGLTNARSGGPAPGTYPR